MRFSFHSHHPEGEREEALRAYYRDRIASRTKELSRILAEQTHRLYSSVDEAWACPVHPSIANHAARQERTADAPKTAKGWLAGLSRHRESLPSRFSVRLLLAVVLQSLSWWVAYWPNDPSSPTARHGREQRC